MAAAVLLAQSKSNPQVLTQIKVLAVISKDCFLFDFLVIDSFGFRSNPTSGASKSSMSSVIFLSREKSCSTIMSKREPSEEPAQESKRVKIFKIKVSNLSYKITKKLITAHIASLVSDISFSVKKAPDWDYCFVQLDSSESQDAVYDLIAGSQCKDRILECEKVTTTEAVRQVKKVEIDPNADYYKLLDDQITPLHSLDYADQVKTKERYIRSACKVCPV